ncbi:hypothetical protein F5148DRAFT_1152263 [Russula earlei]|uniref:Uncharacterized protein n=1 Tax=Russula earlei TaxID=71964 RepID=A0ACC0TWY4_9AGAM|nr:hypothetical protein F5148DRAFT_1152263 [Russula earlei]
MPAPPRKKARTCSVEVEEIDDMDSPGWTVAGSFETPNSKKKAGNVKRSPVYLFYEVISKGSHGSLGEDGDVHYCCLHGIHKMCTIKKKMRTNVIQFIGGWVDTHNSQTSFLWLMTFYAFLALLLPLSRYSLVDRT